MTTFDKNVIRELLSQEGLIITEIDLDDDKYIAEILIEVNSIGLYSPCEIGLISGKIEKLEAELAMKGFIHDIKFGDLYKGNWRLLIHFLNEEEIEEWEEKVIRQAYKAGL